MTGVAEKELRWNLNTNGVALIQLPASFGIAYEKQWMTLLDQVTQSTPVQIEVDCGDIALLTSDALRLILLAWKRFDGRPPFRLTHLAEIPRHTLSIANLLEPLTGQGSQSRRDGSSPSRTGRTGKHLYPKR